MAWTIKLAAIATVGCLVTPSASAGDWRLAIGGAPLEGISADGILAGGQFHLNLTSETAVLRFSFPAASGGRPARAAAARVRVTGFDPVLSCGAVGDAGVVIEGDRLHGELDCSEPPGIVSIDGTFNLD